MGPSSIGLEKNVAMFSSIGVFSERELQGEIRLIDVLHGVVEMEALTMIDDQQTRHSSVKKADAATRTS